MGMEKANGECKNGGADDLFGHKSLIESMVHTAFPDYAKKELLISNNSGSGFFHRLLRNLPSGMFFDDSTPTGSASRNKKAPKNASDDCGDPTSPRQFQWP